MSAKRTRTQTVALSALFIALLIVSCFITIPIGPVPFTLQTAVVILIALICSPKEAATITAIYLFMGAIGLPVFSGMTGGIVRASTGFLAGFVIGSSASAALRLLIARASGKTVLADIIAAVIYMVIADVLGLIWYVFFGGVTVGEAFVIMVAPFIIVDVIKAALAISIARGVRAALNWE